MKGHMKDGKFHPHKPYKKGVRKRRMGEKPLDYNDPELIQAMGIKMEKPMMRSKRDEPDLNKIIENTEKDFEKALKQESFNNPKLRDQDWSVSITYEGGFSEEYFNFQASIVGTDKVYSERSFISNFDWSEGLGDNIMKKLDEDSEFAQREYDKWLTETFETVADGFYEQLVGAIEDT